MLMDCNISYIKNVMSFSKNNLSIFSIFENESKTSTKVETHVVDMAFHLSTD